MNHQRRQFVRAGSCGLMGASTLTSTLLNLGLATNAVMAGTHSEYKALVCILLSGGNDSWNMLIPADDEPHREYSEARGDLAISLSGELAALPLGGHSDRTYAVHPSCTNIQQLYNKGDLAFVSNVGTLIEPTTVKQYRAKSARLPNSLFSHLDQREQWQTSFPQSRLKSGWLGRATERLKDYDRSVDSIPINISLSGNNLLQTGDTFATSYNIGKHGSVPIELPWLMDLLRQDDTKTSGVFNQEYSALSVNSINLEKFFSAAYDREKITTPFPNNSLALNLKSIATTIAARKDLSHQRQTFFVLFDGWDHHQELLSKHAAHLRILDESLAAFQKTLQALGVSESVTTFTISDFGRALVSNGDGTDHGWGGNCLLMGGGVNGGQVLGEYPTVLRPKSGLDVGQNGRLLPTTSCDTYFYELLKWFGVKNNDFEDILPNLTNFLDPHSNINQIGLFT